MERTGARRCGVGRARGGQEGVGGHGEAGYVRWRNARAQPKTSFAASSPIRSRTSYPAKVA
ncbi:hypothetical protein C1J01_12790 [Nonomuraea aridisoli]|uniref:Uncharacterized protein n=1 Tax=Nonomuraea aridisoli TaxID=2070368 RepID=A0A2W2E4L0_9ACTN|nr:hypothetical protein C1J01_12790 [Nonomuraea aridisoli]